VIVYEYDRRGALEYGRPKHFPRMDEGRIQDTPGYEHVTEHTVLRVQKERVELLVWEVTHPGPHEVVDVFRPVNPRTFG
jgi:hypothetical protein